MNRREFLISTGVLLAAGPAQGQASGDAKPPFRTITYNVLALKGYPERRTNVHLLERARPQMAQRLALELGLYAPDVITLQEAPTEEKVAEAAKHLGFNYVYFDGGFPGALLTRHEITDSENSPIPEGERSNNLFTRHWGRAVVDTGSQQIHYYSIHMHPRETKIRQREAKIALDVMRPDLDAGVPLVFQGDLNHTPQGPEYALWQGAGLVDCGAAVGDDSPSMSTTNPRYRIDHIWCAGPLAQRIQSCRVLYENAFRADTNIDASFALSDHIPVMAEFRT